MNDAGEANEDIVPILPGRQPRPELSRRERADGGKDTDFLSLRECTVRAEYYGSGVKTISNYTFLGIEPTSK